MNTATNTQQKKWSPKARWRASCEGSLLRAVMAAAVGLLMGSPAPVVYAHGGNASLVHACVKASGGQTRIVGPSVSCNASEAAVDWSITGPAGPAGVAGPAGPPGPAFPITCPLDSVLTGTTCIDMYEASVWKTTDAALIASIQDGAVTLAALTAAGAVQQFGLAPGDLAAAGCPDTGNGCVNFYAVSIPGVTPSTGFNWFQAAAAARNAGKRLPSNAEWQAAALGTPDPGASAAGSEDCNTANGGGAGVPAVVPTGSRDDCASDVGAFDLVGNLDEWVAD